MAPHSRKAGAATLAAVLFAWSGGEAVSQAADAGGAGLRFVLDYEARIEADTNPRFGDDESGAGLQFLNEVDLAFLSETRNQAFALTFGTVARYSSADSGELEGFTLTEPTYALSYERVAANATLSVEADYRERRIEFLEPFFIDNDGDSILDEAGFSRSDGSLTEVGARVTLVTGRQSPIGTTYTAAYRSRTYEESEDPDLFDSVDYRVGTVTRFRLSEVATGQITTRLRQYDYDEGREVDGDVYSISAGYSRAVSPTLEFDVSLGVSHTSVDEVENGESLLEEDTGLNAELGVVKTLPNGTLFAEFERGISDGEFRNSLSFGRTLEMRGYGLTASVGLTQWDDRDGVEPIIELGYVRELPDGAFGASLQRAVTVNTVDDENTVTALTVDYNKQINELSSLVFDVSLARVQSVSDADDDTRTEAAVTASIARELTRDWSMQVGYRGRLNESEEDSSFSNAVFLAIGRSFTFRP